MFHRHSRGNSCGMNARVPLPLAGGAGGGQVNQQHHPIGSIILSVRAGMTSPEGNLIRCLRSGPASGRGTQASLRQRLVFLISICFFLSFTSVVQAAPPSGSFFPILPFDAAPDAKPSLLPIASNHPLDADHTGLTRAIIVIHDFSRDAGRALATMTALAGDENSATMIMAPQFLLDSDITRFADNLPDKGRDFARWSIGGWGSGADSLPAPPQKSISSFTALDLMLLYLADHASFPDMKEITVIGHGEGGDFVQRYTATGQAPDLLAQQKLPVHFVVADASSYLYLNTIRPREKRQGFSPPDEAACKDYNIWPYGLDGLNAYAKRAGMNAIKTRFAMRQVAYLVGADAGKNDPAPDTGCAALFQGVDRPTRAVNYVTYTGLLFGEAAAKRQDLTVVPGVGYDADALYSSTCGMTLLFGDGDCTPPTLKSTENP